MNHYVYEITNLINGKKYIGKRSCNCPIKDDKYMGSGKYLKMAIKKYGKENFKKEVLEVCSDTEECFNREIYYIQKFNAVQSNRYYNQASGGAGGYSNYANKTPEELIEIRKKISLANKGKVVSDYTRKKLSESLSGKKKTLAHRISMSKCRIGKRTGSENPMYNKTHSDEARRKISESKQKYVGENHPRYGVKLSKEVKEKISNSNKGKKHSEETKNLYSEMRKGEGNPRAKKVICLNTKDTFNCMTEAVKLVGLKSNVSILRCCKNILKGKYHSAGAINGEPAIWMYYDDYINLSYEEIDSLLSKNIEKAGKTTVKKVILLNNGKVFNNLSEASFYVGQKSIAGISQCCNGKQITAGKTPSGERAKWMFYDDYLRKNAN